MCELCNLFKKLCNTGNGKATYLYPMMINEQLELDDK